MSKKRIFCFGLGYVARHLMAFLDDDWSFVASYRGDQPSDQLLNLKGDISDRLQLVKFDNGLLDKEGQLALSECPYVLASVPPDEKGCPVARALRTLGIPYRFHWVGYLSATSVYGDAAGQWVDERHALNPGTKRGKNRRLAEEQWLSLYRSQGWPVAVFRLSGIYGPGRNMLERLKGGLDQAVVKPGHVMGRIHVDDIVSVLTASMTRPMGGEIYNVSDDLPAPSSEVLQFAAQLLGLEAPTLVPYDEAVLSPMARSFYLENRRVSNDKIQQQLGVTLKYPDYKSGLTSLKISDSH